MGEMHMIPTTSLRFIERTICVTENGKNVVRAVRVLQQLFEYQIGPYDGMKRDIPSDEWRDVPFVTDADREPG